MVSVINHLLNLYNITGEAVTKLYNPIRVLTKDEMYKIHNTSLEILEKTGIKMLDAEALRIMDKSGAVVDFKTQVVKFPRDLVEDTMRKLKGKSWSLYTLEGREVKISSEEPAFSTQLDIGTVAGRTGSFSMYILDLDRKDRRLATEKDVVDSIRLADALDNIKIVGVPVSDQQLPPALRIIHAAEILVNNTRKLGQTEVFSVDDQKYIIKIASLVAGGLEELRKKPILLTPLEATSPLTYSPQVLENIRLLAEYGLPITFYTMPLLGVTAPTTIAGAIALGNAEVWAGATLAKLINPEVNVGLGLRVPVLDQKTLAHSYAAPEHQLALIASLQLFNEFYNVTNRNATGLRTDANFPGIQAGYEKALTGMSVMLAGATLIGNLGFLRACETFSYEQLVIDNEIVSMLNRYVKGFYVTEETLALDVIKEVGIGGHFLSHQHTLKYFKSEMWLPDLTDRRGWREWKTSGAKDILEKAKEKVTQILNSHYPKPLDKDTQREIKKIVKEADKKLLKTSHY
jgi:trimethylamine--corrinoid protein Co-methyltransferase